MELLHRILQPPASRAFASADEFWREHVTTSAAFVAPMDRAIAGGAIADRLGYAFVAGYVAALQALVPGCDPSERISLAATEEGGAHPKAIRTTLRHGDGGWTLEGEKAWVTLGSERLLVLANAGEQAEGRARLVLVALPPGRAGVTLVPQPPLPFVPEVAHAKVRLAGVQVKEDELLPGDGWQHWVKPFRTVEDVHVHAAALAYLGATASRLGWPRPLQERLAATLLTFRSLSSEDMASPAIHVALAGAISAVRALVEECTPQWSSAPSAERERWERDRPLLEVAARARQARLERAWARLAR